MGENKFVCGGLLCVLLSLVLKMWKSIQILSQGNFFSTAPTSHRPVSKCDQALDNTNAPTRCLQFFRGESFVLHR